MESHKTIETPLGIKVLELSKLYDNSSTHRKRARHLAITSLLDSYSIDSVFKSKPEEKDTIRKGYLLFLLLDIGNENANKLRAMLGTPPTARLYVEALKILEIKNINEIAVTDQIRFLTRFQTFIQLSQLLEPILKKLAETKKFSETTTPKKFMEDIFTSLNSIILSISPKEDKMEQSEPESEKLPAESATVEEHIEQDEVSGVRFHF